MLTADRYRFNGKEHNILPKVKEVVDGLREVGLEHVVIVGQLEKSRRPTEIPEYGDIDSIVYPDFLDKDATEVEFWRGPATAPLWVLYSSGTSASSITAQRDER